MSQSYDPDQIERIRSTRQVLAGDEVQPLTDPWARPTGPLGLTPLQLQYVAGVLILLVIGAILIPVAGIGVASVPLFILGLALLAGWLLF
jgi:hypothetical protein